MNLTQTMPPSGEVLRLPSALASECTIGGLNPSQLRLAVVLAAMAYHAPHGEWTIAKPILEQLTHIVLDNAEKLIAPLRSAMLEKEGVVLPLFSAVEYTPGVRFKSAGMITVRLDIAARDTLYSHGKTVLIAADEFRGYSTIGGIMLRLRLGGRMQAKATSQVDIWRLKPEDLAKPNTFGSYASGAVIRRTVKGETVEYVSLSRAVDTLIQRGVAEINAGSRGARIEINPIKSGADVRARWLAVELETRRVFDEKPKPKPKMSDIKNRSKQPALAPR